MLDTEEIRAIRKSWAHLSQAREIAGPLFYERLFAIAPQTRALFREDIELQGRKLMATIGFVVDHLDDPEPLTTAATELAIRHVGYGVTADQYAPVGEALLWTLKEMLGPTFGEAEHAAWAAAYGGLSALMIEAASRDGATP